MARVEMAPDWCEKVLGAWDTFAGTRLGPDIAHDAERYAPMGRTVVADPRHPRTPPHLAGELKGSIDYYLERHTLIVHARAPYALFVEMGTRPHIISAHGPWSLRSGATGEYFGPVAHHPGTRPQPFLRPALYKVRGE